MPHDVILADHSPDVCSSANAVTQLVYDSGLSQWNTVEVCPTTPVAELMADRDSFPIVLE